MYPNKLTKEESISTIKEAESPLCIIENPSTKSDQKEGSVIGMMFFVKGRITTVSFTEQDIVNSRRSPIWGFSPPLLVNKR